MTQRRPSPRPTHPLRPAVRRPLAAAVTGLLAVGTATAVPTATAAAAPGTATTAEQAPRAAAGPRAIGLSPDGTLHSFRLGDPGAATEVGTVRGLLLDTEIVGIDRRPADDEVYAVGNNGGVYTLEPTTARLTRSGQLTVPLDGDRFGVDVNPAADALRIVSDTGQNLRYAFGTRQTTADADLNLTDSATGEVSTVTGVVGAAYTNNDTSTETGTALLDVDTAADRLLLQVPANAGVITPQGALGIRPGGDVGFDVASRVVDGRATHNRGFLVTTGGGRSTLFDVEPTSGRASRIGRFGAGVSISDLAVLTDLGPAFLGTRSPARRSRNAFGLTANGTLVTFPLARPSRERVVGRPGALRPLRVVGIDVRPADGRLYAVGRDGRLFTLDRRTARATRVGRLDVPLRGRYFGVDVNPAADALRIVSNTGQNLRHVFEGDVTTADTPLNVPDTTPRVAGVVAAAYTNNDTSDATGTALFDLDAATDSVVLQVPANAGTITSQGALGVAVGPRAGLDVATLRRGGRAVGNVGYATVPRGRSTTLHRIGVLTGDSSRVGRIGRVVVDLAVG